ncbi:hypothetical protein WJX74_007371 [Apatococcus lobatus]|uniref:Uncharacterized protein n=1 Tax=Apatococcus lobatus TaxID=904363 RepID=A0AAW1QV08_9CHLO
MTAASEVLAAEFLLNLQKQQAAREAQLQQVLKGCVRKTDASARTAEHETPALTVSAENLQSAELREEIAAGLVHVRRRGVELHELHEQLSQATKGHREHERISSSIHQTLEAVSQNLAAVRAIFICEVHSFLSSRRDSPTQLQDGAEWSLQMERQLGYEKFCHQACRFLGSEQAGRNRITRWLAALSDSIFYTVLPVSRFRIALNLLTFSRTFGAAFLASRLVSGDVPGWAASNMLGASAAT